jgi:branched-chain amino acid transport system substrate-binding protein
MERGADLAVADINAAGGVLGQKVELITADDFCDPEQAVAAARKLVSNGVVFAAGHWCSHASISASEIYEAAQVLLISPGSVNPTLTELGRANVFRVCGRHDRQGAMVADYLASHSADKDIAIVDDDLGAGVAHGVRRRLRELEVPVAMDETFTSGEEEYSDLVSRMQAAGIDVSFPGDLHRVMGLIFRQARARGYDLQLVSSSSSAIGDLNGSMASDPALW